MRPQWVLRRTKANRPLLLFSPLRRQPTLLRPSSRPRPLCGDFWNNYQGYTPATVDQNLATALNMMTANLRTYSLGKLRDEDTVGKIKEDRIISQFRIRTIEPVKNAPWTYVAFGVKEIHRVRNRVESTDRIVGRYNVRLLQDRRSESNPSGLLVAEFSEQQMVGERDGDLLQQSQLSGEMK